MSFGVFQITSFAQGTLWCLQTFYFGRGKGGKFPCFQCGKWKICKLIQGKNQEKVQNPKGNAFSFLFQAALSLWPCVGTVERKLSLRMGSLWLLGCCCQGEGGMEHGVTRGGQGPGPGQLLPLASKPFLQLLLSGGVAPAAPWDALGRLRTRPHHPWGHWGELQVRGCSYIPIQSQSLQIWPPKGIFDPLVFAFKGTILDFTKIPSLSVLGHSSFQRHWTALGVGVKTFP